VLSLCHDPVILNAVLRIIQNMIACYAEEGTPASSGSCTSNQPQSGGGTAGSTPAPGLSGNVGSASVDNVSTSGHHSNTGPWQQLVFLQSFGFGGLWRFAGAFTKVRI
jgi:hypothetical protein